MHILDQERDEGAKIKTKAEGRMFGIVDGDGDGDGREAGPVAGSQGHTEGMRVTPAPKVESTLTHPS